MGMAGGWAFRRDCSQRMRLRLDLGSGSRPAGDGILYIYGCQTWVARCSISSAAGIGGGGAALVDPADYIFADKTTITGSIGVFGMIPNINNFLRYRLGSY